MKELEKPLYCLYLMCDEKERYRIGKTTLYNKDKEGKAYNGLRQRMLAEKCSKGWVLKVSFDEKEILLQTADGKLQIRGSGLHVKGLNLEKGEATLAGHVDSLVYLSKDSPRKEEPLFTRLFR